MKDAKHREKLEVGSHIACSITSGVMGLFLGLSTRLLIAPFFFTRYLTWLQALQMMSEQRANLNRIDLAFQKTS